MLVTVLDPDRHLDYYLGFARELRAAAIPTEVVLEGGSLRRQLAYASRKQIPLAVIAGDREFADGGVLLRDLGQGSQEPVPAATLVAAVRERIRVDSG